ncbi:MAG TPA: hypothetical protein VIL13_08985 [Longimicrobiales bacterium]
MNRLIAAGVLTFLASGVLAWWVKGDLEMVWLLFMLIFPVAGGVIGLIAALPLRAPILVSMTTIGPAAAALALAAAARTPNAWDSRERARVERQAASLAADLPRIEALARKLLGAGVDVSGAHPTVTGGRIRKEPFRFGLEREPAAAELRVHFALGPEYGLTLRLDGDSLVADSAQLEALRRARWRITEAALRRRFDAHTVRLARNESKSEWVPGTLLPLRLDYGERDWTLLVLRIGGPDGLEVVRTISRDESRAALAQAAARAGREVRDVVIYFTPNQGGVFFEHNVWFDFIGIPVDGSANLRLRARFSDDGYSYDAGRWFSGRGGPRPPSALDP